jgi:type I restriction enzyme S subunit
MTVAELERQGVLLVQDGNHGASRPVGDEILPAGRLGIAHIRAADIDDSGWIDFDGAQQLASSAYERIRKGRARAGDTLLSHKGTVGRVARVRSSAPDFLCSPQTTFWRSLDEAVVDPSYLHCYLRSPEFQQQLRQRMHETDMAPYVSLTSQRGLSLRLPPVDAQRRIAGVLDALDDKIDSNRRMAALLEETASTVFRARFVDFVGVEELQDSEIGRIPKGWSVAPAGDILPVVGGSTPSTSEPTYWDGDQWWATPKDLSGLETPVILRTSRQITRLGVERISSRVLPVRTVLLSSRAPVGYTAIAAVPLSINQGFIAIPPVYGVPPEWVLFWLRSNMETIKANAGGTTFAEISKKAFRPIPMVVPPREVLADFGEVAAPSFDRIIGLEAERRTLVQIRDLLLPKLISGQLRVRDTADSDDALGAVIGEAA